LRASLWCAANADSSLASATSPNRSAWRRRGGGPRWDRVLGRGAARMRLGGGGHGPLPWAACPADRTQRPSPKASAAACADLAAAATARGRRPPPHMPPLPPHLHHGQQHRQAVVQVTRLDPGPHRLQHSVQRVPQHVRCVPAWRAGAAQYLRHKGQVLRAQLR
jgi:hypothetical protein